MTYAGIYFKSAIFLVILIRVSLNKPITRTVDFMITVASIVGALLIRDFYMALI